MSPHSVITVSLAQDLPRRLCLQSCVLAEKEVPDLWRLRGVLWQREAVVAVGAC